MSKTHENVMLHFIQKFPHNARAALSTGILSLSAGLSAVCFLFFTNLLFAKTYLIFATKSKTFFVIASFTLITTTSLLVGYLLNVFSPDAAGSGIPQIKTAYWKDLGAINGKSILIKFVAGVLSIGGGNSLGREGPSVFVGSGVSSKIDGLLGTPLRERRGAAVIGAAAGLAAAFNTPLAAITFVIEEIIGDLNSRYLGRVVLSALIGALTVYAVLGKQPAFSLPPVDNVSWLHYLIVPLVALFASLAGIVFQLATLKWRGRLNKQKRIPVWLLPVLGGLITWAVGSIVFLATGKTGVFGLGYRDLSHALQNDFGWKVAGVLVIAKLLATITGYSFGGCGGIFAPSLFIGGLTGYFFSGLVSIWIPLTPADHIVLAAVGMSACLGAIVRAPLTSMLIVFEMTHQFALVPGLMLGTIISQTIAHFAGKLNFYDALLVQDGHELHKIRPPLDLLSWHNLPVSAIANPHPVSLSTLDEPEMRKTLENYPYSNFPVIRSSRILGIITRQQMQLSLQKHVTPEINKALTCYPDQTIRQIGDKFIKSSSYVLLVVDRKSQSVSGIVTLHDLLRAQAAIQN